MSSTRTWAVGTAVVSILLVVATWFLMIGPKRTEAADLRTQKSAQDAKNSQLTLSIAQLKSQFASLPAKQAELQVIQRQLPNNPALPTLIRSLSGIATASGATLFEVAPQQPLAATVAASPTGTTGAAAATTGAASTGQAAANLVNIPITITIHGSYAESELFLQKLQTGMTRALLVNQLSIKPFADTTSGAAASSSSQASGDFLETVITGSVFVLPTPVKASTSTGVTTGTTGAVTSTGSAS